MTGADIKLRNSQYQRLVPLILLTQLRHRGEYTIRPAPHTLCTNRGRSLDFTFRLFPITHLTSLITKLAGELVGGQRPSGAIDPSTKPTPTKAGLGPEERKQAHRIPSGFVFAQQTVSCWPWRGWSRNRPRSCYRGELCQPFAALRCAFAPAEFNGACSCQDFFAGGGNGKAF